MTAELDCLETDKSRMIVSAARPFSRRTRAKWRSMVAIEWLSDG
jgi:hypothetical protein